MKVAENRILIFLGCLSFFVLSPATQASNDRLNSVDQLLEDYLWWLPSEKEEEIAKAVGHIDRYWDDQESKPETNRLDVDLATLAYDFPRISTQNWENYLVWLEDRSVIDDSNEAYRTVKLLLDELAGNHEQRDAYENWENAGSNFGHSTDDYETSPPAGWLDNASFGNQLDDSSNDFSLKFSSSTGIKNRIVMDPNNLALRPLFRPFPPSDLSNVSPDANHPKPVARPGIIHYNDCGAFRWTINFDLDRKADNGGLFVTTIHWHYHIKDAIGRQLYSPTWNLPFMREQPFKQYQEFFVFEYLNPMDGLMDPATGAAGVYPLTINMVDYPFGFDLTQGQIHVQTSSRFFDVENNPMKAMPDAMGNFPVWSVAIPNLNNFTAQNYNPASAFHQRFRRFHGFKYGTRSWHPVWDKGSQPTFARITSNWDCSNPNQFQLSKPQPMPRLPNAFFNHVQSRWVLKKHGNTSYRYTRWRGRDYSHGGAYRLPY